MTTDFSLVDIMGNITGGSVSPDDAVTTATTQVSQTEEPKKSFINPKYALKTDSVAPTADTGTYDRMLQAESNNKNYDAQGRPITSNKGAMFAGQVMPATAANPGYGIKPAANQTPEEYNRVGREYYQAMLKKFGGDERKAAAAYNSGPGTVDKNIAANKGQLNTAQLPRETQGYLGKVFKGVGDIVGNMIPSAQAGTLPPRPAPVAAVTPTPTARPAFMGGQPGFDEAGTPIQANGMPGVPTPAPVAAVTPAPVAAVSPEQAAQQPAPTEQPYTGQGLKIGGMTAGQLQQEKDHTAILNSNSQEQIGKLAFDFNASPAVRNAALDKLYQTNSIQTKVDEVNKKIAAMQAAPGGVDPRAINKAMNDRDTGSVFKAIFYGLMGATKKRDEEWDRIDPKVSYSGMQVGDNAYSVKTNANTGEVVAAWDSKGQKIIDPAVLGEIAANGVNPATAKSFLMPQTAGSPVTKTVNGQVINGIQIYDPVSKKFYVQYGNKRDTNPQGWTSASQNVEQQDALARMRGGVKIETLRSELGERIRAKPVEEANKIITEHNTKYADNIPLQQYTPGGPTLTARPQAGTPPAPTGSVVPQGGAVAAPVIPGTSAATGQVPAPAPQAAPVVTAPAPAVSGGRRPGESIQEFEDRKKLEESTKKIDTEAGPKADAEGRKELVKDATKVLTQLPDTANLISNINKSIKLIDSGNTNIGPIGSALNPETKANQLPGEKTLGKVFGTEDARNTKTVMDLVRKLAADGLKALGSNPSTVDLLFWTENKPTEDDAPEYVKEWMETRRDDLQRRIQFHKDVIKNKGNLPAGLTADTPAQSGNKTILEEKTINGVTYVNDGKGWKKK